MIFSFFIFTKDHGVNTSALKVSVDPSICRSAFL
jgi:hypothetical protein